MVESAPLINYPSNGLLSQEEIIAGLDDKHADQVPQSIKEGEFYSPAIGPKRMAVLDPGPASAELNMDC